MGIESFISFNASVLFTEVGQKCPVQAGSMILKVPVLEFGTVKNSSDSLIRRTCFIISSSFWKGAYASQMKSQCLLPKRSLNNVVEYCRMTYDMSLVFTGTKLLVLFASVFANIMQTYIILDHCGMFLLYLVHHVVLSSNSC